jgi:hypothetical protein
MPISGAAAIHDIGAIYHQYCMRSQLDSQKAFPVLALALSLFVYT